MRYELVRSNRRTLALTVDRGGNLTVRAPLRMPAAQIETFVRAKQDWIEKTRVRLSQLPPPAEPLSLGDGATMPYLGRTLTLRRAAVARVTLSGDTLLFPLSAADTSPLIRWLEAQVRVEFDARVSRLSRALNLHPKTIRLSRAHGRWGSMSGRGTLSLNRALILCPPEVMDYVIIHELCHIAHPNHSAAFWALVERCLPGCRAWRAWLKSHNSLIFVLPDEP
ncbi:MAG: M48 family metallopeptidase [Clostridiales bacterium]|nr:M48 family metallopeptidase [Clostridiales bacterium]